MSRQRVLVELQREHHRNGGWPVHVRHLAQATGLASTATIHHHLRTLEAHQLVEKGPARHDGWRPT